jgi:hypothetical protein
MFKEPNILSEIGLPGNGSSVYRLEFINTDASRSVTIGAGVGVGERVSTSGDTRKAYWRLKIPGPEVVRVDTGVEGFVLGWLLTPA